MWTLWRLFGQSLEELLRIHQLCFRSRRLGDGLRRIFRPGSRIRHPTLTCFLRPGSFYVDLGGLGVLVAEDAAGQRVLYLVVSASLLVDDYGEVAVPDLLDGVLSLLC